MQPTATLKRPALRYHGGKWKLAPWILSHFGPHSLYTEAFGGAASVLLRKPRTAAEVWNDLDGELHNFFCVLRDPLLAARLREQLHYTKYSQREFEAAYAPQVEPVERARCLVVRSFMGFGSSACNLDHNTGFRATALRNNGGKLATGPATEWATYPDLLPALTERLRGVLLENRPALDVLSRHDSPTTLHYVDPPYPFGPRSAHATANNNYQHELTDADHRTLANCLHQLRGAVVLSGYGCDLYDQELYADWQRIERPTHADGARTRMEVLWLNPAASAARHVLALQ